MTLQTDVLSNNSVAARIYLKTNNWVKAKRILNIVMKFGNICLKRNIKISEEKIVNVFLQYAQLNYYGESCGRMNKRIPLEENDSLLGLEPFLDFNGIIRVGGRLQHSSMSFDNKHQILLPTQHPVTEMMLNHYHERKYHQGRHITLGAVRQGSFHIHKSRRVLDKLLKNSTICRRLRRPKETQMDANLPASRLEESPPFTNVGVDVFGPYMVHDGSSTRRTNANKKVWATLFTCLCTCAVHIEPIPLLDTAAFKMALKRFTAIRGQCKYIHSDRGTNFVGAKNQILEKFDMDALRSSAEIAGLKWQFTPPGASHFGGVWQRKVGAIKSVLAAALHQLGPRSLSCDELHTLLQEAACIVNDTPLYEVTADPNDPSPNSKYAPHLARRSKPHTSR